MYYLTLPVGVCTSLRFGSDPLASLENEKLSLNLGQVGQTINIGFYLEMTILFTALVLAEHKLSSSIQWMPVS